MDNKLRILANQIDEIVKDFLFRIDYLGDHNHFSNPVRPHSYIYNTSRGFSCISSDDCNNSYVVREEIFLEGCTRVFLVNPIFKALMDINGIENDWFLGTTFGKFISTNAEQEMESTYEFIAVLNGKRIGVRYAKPGNSLNSMCIINGTTSYKNRRTNIFGFEKINSVDIIQYLDWSGVSNEDLKQFGFFRNGYPHYVRESSVKDFLEEYFSADVYELFIQKTKEAISKARDIIALNAIPQMLPNNIINLKQGILDKFSLSQVKTYKYSFKDNKKTDNCLSESDYEIMNNNFFGKKYCNAIVGNAPFAESFITSEYLFRYMKSGLCIDYTAVVVGYLKAIEQLLYAIYVSSFNGRNKLRYWDTCHRTKDFDLEKDNYRINPYAVKDEDIQQEKYNHKLKATDKIEMGELNRFLRYFSEIWQVSETGKEYIFHCLEDFRDSCRNSHFHKDNIDAEQYDEVLRIKNNAYVCLYYLLSGFKFMNSSETIEHQLGIIDYRFEKIYGYVRKKGNRYYIMKYSDGTEQAVYYLFDDDVKYNKDGMILDANLRFLKINKPWNEVFQTDAEGLIDDPIYRSENMLLINRSNINFELKQFRPKRNHE